MYLFAEYAEMEYKILMKIVKHVLRIMAYVVVQYVEMGS
jgi:hypothetical protein